MSNCFMISDFKLNQAYERKISITAILYLSCVIFSCKPEIINDKNIFFISLFISLIKIWIKHNICFY